MADFLTVLPVLLVLIAITLWVLRRFEPEERSWLWLSFFTHQLAAIGMIILTESYYGGGDMLSYQVFGLEAAHRLRQDFFGLAPALVGLIFQQPDPLPIPIRALSSNTGSMQGVSAFAMFFFNDSLYATCAAMAGGAFFAKLALYVTAKAELPDLGRRAKLFACMLVPSAVFWSSGLLKEPIAVMGLFVAVYAWRRLLVGEGRFGALLLLAASVVPIALMKGYILPVLGIAAAFWYVVRNTAARRSNIAITTGHLAVAGALAAVVIVATGTALPEFALENLEEEAANLQLVGARVEGGSNYSLGQSSGNVGSQLTLIPMGLVTALFRPALFETTNALVFLNAVEMTGFSILVGIVLFRRGLAWSLSELFRRPFLGFCCAFVLMFATGVGIASTNLGSLSRYRMPMMPFFALLLVSLTARRKTEEGEHEAHRTVGPLPLPGYRRMPETSRTTM